MIFTFKEEIYVIISPVIKKQEGCLVNPALYICCFLPLIIILFMQRSNSNEILRKRICANKKTKEQTIMNELVLNFIGKECIIYTYNGSQHLGTITAVKDNFIEITEKNNVEILNLDFILRIREHPKDKNGKKKSVFF